MATADAKRPRLRMMARPMRVCMLTCSFQTMGMGMRANSRSVAIFIEELKTPTFLKMIAL